MGSSRLWYAAAVTAGLSLAACFDQPVTPDTGTTSRALTFPALDSDWNPIPQLGVGIEDIFTDGQNNGREIVGDPANPAMFMASNGTEVFFRFRLDDDPTNQGSLRNFGWGVLFNTDGDPNDYEYSLIVDGSGNPQRIVYGFNDVQGTVGDPSDDVETEIASITLDDVPPDHNIVITPTTSTLNGTPDFFLDFGIPLTTITGHAEPPPRLDLTQPMQIMGGTSSSAQNLSIDLAGCDVLDIQACQSDPIVLTCGNGQIEGSETCDDGNLDPTDGCDATCQTVSVPVCGDGNVDTGEACDDGNTAPGDGCNALCEKENGEPCTADAECESTNCNANTGLCDSCGNGVLQVGEGCDDGNNTPGDGCNAACLIEDGELCNQTAPGNIGNTSCESGVCDITDGLPGTCESGCGNGLLEAGEGCDDGNTAPGDGCNAVCLIEDTFPCNDTAPGNTGDTSCGTGFCDTSDGAPGVCVPQTDTDMDDIPDVIDLDDDNDGIPDDEEGFGDVDGDGVPNHLDLDTDNDGIPDVVEAGHDSVDDDGDGVVDCVAGFGNNGLCDELETAPDSGDADYDGDGAGPDLPVDTDGDGVDDYKDLDADNDGIPDLTEGDTGCVDADASGVCDGPDSDGDGIPDSIDEATGFGDGGYTDPPDTDGDGADDYRDVDTDNDGIPDTVEGIDGGPQVGCVDSDRNGVCDGPDTDGDGIVDSIDELDGHGDTEIVGPPDTDGDGTPDFRDLESDGDNIPDVVEGGNGELDGNGDGRIDRAEDGDGDGIADVVDDQPGSFGGLADPGIDEDSDGRPNFQDPDDDGNGVRDDLGVAGGGCNASGAGAGELGMLFLIGLWLVPGLLRRRRSARWIGIAGSVAIAWLGATTTTAHAQDMGVAKDFPVERFRLAMDGDGMLDIEWAGVPKHLDWDVGLWLGLSDDPLVVYSDIQGDRERRGALVTHRLAGTLVAAIGLWDRLQLGIEVPIIFSQDQEQIAGIMDTALGTAGFGDIRLMPKLQLVANDELRLALAASVTVPSGGASDYRGDEGLTFAPELMASQRFGQFRASANLGYRARQHVEFANLVVDDEVFARVGGAYSLDRDGSGPPLELGLGVSLATGASSLFGDFNRNHLELIGGATYDFTGPLIGVLALGAGLEEGFGTPDWRLVAGVRWSKRKQDQDGDGVLDAEDSCPLVPEDADSFEDSDGCPDLDNDEDGVPDAQDGAPMEPEDKDGYADEDGVPDPDNDQDGIADAGDQCPLEAEVVNSFQDDDGCPDEVPDSDSDGLADNVDKCPQQAEDLDSFEDVDGCPDVDNDKDGVLDTVDECVNEAGVIENEGCPDTDRDGDTVVDRLDNCPDEAGDPANFGCVNKQSVKIVQGKFEILDKVHFATNRDTIQRRSYALLRNVAQVLNAHPEVGLVQVEGHTDDRGNDAFNLDLSQRRAEAVVAFLVKQGVAAERLVAKGFGETAPIADNTNAQGRADNRRVEFKILSRPDGVIRTPPE